MSYKPHWSAIRPDRRGPLLSNNGGCTDNDPNHRNSLRGMRRSSQPTSERSGWQIAISLLRSTHQYRKGNRHLLGIDTHTGAGLPICYEIFGNDADAKLVGNSNIKIPIFASLRSSWLGSCEVEPDLIKSGRTEQRHTSIANDVS